MARKRNDDGTFAPGNGGGPGAPTKRNSGRHWLARNYERPESDRAKVPFSPADAATRRLVDGLKKMNGRELVGAVMDIHSDLYGNKSDLTSDGAPLFARIERRIVKPS